MKTFCGSLLVLLAAAAGLASPAAAETLAVHLEIDLYDSADHFTFRIRNDSTSASVTQAVITGPDSRTFDAFLPGATYTVSPSQASSNNDIRVQTVTLAFSGTGLAAGASDQNGTGSDLDWAARADFNVSVTFSGGQTLSGVMTNIGDADDGNIRLYAADISFVSEPPPPPGSSACSWFASPTGSSTADGSLATPWSLAKALSGGYPAGSIHPGDTLCLKGGVYTGSFPSSLTGNSTDGTWANASPITVRSAPGEWAVIDGQGVASSSSIFTVDGAWAVYRDFEIMSSSTTSRDNNKRPVAVYVRNTSNIKLVNLVIHDAGQGLYTEPAAGDVEIYGLVIYNHGSQDATRSYGHAMYLKSYGSARRVSNNIMFNNLGFGIHAYSNYNSGDLLNLHFTANAAFNNGILSDYPSRNFQIGGEDGGKYGSSEDAVADNCTAYENMTYFSPDPQGIYPIGGNLRLGYETVLNGSLDFRNNYIAGGQALTVDYWSGLTLQGNTIIGGSAGKELVRFPYWYSKYGVSPTLSGYAWNGNVYYRGAATNAWLYKTTFLSFPGWQSAPPSGTGFDGGSEAFAGLPSETKVFVHANAYEPGRANIVVYNWGGLSSVQADPSGILQPGDVYEVHNVQRLFCDSPRAVFCSPVASGAYDGTPISIPMDGVAPPAPIGVSPNDPPTTGPAFDVFILKKR